jgi:predicted amidophosphoribosyltransferase
MTRRFDKWSLTTRRAHGAPCTTGCGSKTHTKSGVCIECQRQARSRSYVDPRTMPDSYLEACARELVRRHEKRAELIAKIGIRRAPDVPARTGEGLAA